MGGKVLSGVKFVFPKFVRHGRKRRGDCGVTLIEMMIVLVIIGIIAAVVVPNVIGRPDEARATVARTDIRSISSALELYRLDNRQYPSSRQGLQALVEKPSTTPQPVNWSDGGYLAQVPVDPWGTPYLYRSPGEAGGFDLVSYGSDGKPGGEGVAADLSNRDPAR